MQGRESLTRPTYAEISVENFLFNLSFLKKKNGEHFFCPMLKANAYGHGDDKIIHLCTQADIENVGVATIDEAIYLRNSGFKKNIYVFSPVYKNMNALLLKFSLTPVVSDISHLDELQNMKVHLKLNTGMNRMGINLKDVDLAVNKIKKSGLVLAGVLSHLLDSRDLNKKDGFSQKQISLFQNIIKEKFSHIKEIHLFNSDGLLLSNEEQQYGSRPGIALYGYSSIHDTPLKPVMRLKTKIISIRKIKAGEVVSYGARWTASRDSLIGVLPIGYADGLKRIYSNKYIFYCKDIKIQQIGSICMDYCMVDITDVSDKIKLYDDVIIFGKNRSDLISQAKGLQTIPYELLTSVSERVPRVLVEKFT